MKVKKKTGENIIDKLMGVLLSYPLAIFCILVFALFCSGRVGWFLLLAAVGAPLFSLIWTIIAKKYVSVEIRTGNSILEKGQIGSFDVVIVNRCPLPVPEITVQVGNDEHINIKQKTLTVYSRGMGETVLNAEIFSVFAGPADIRIEKAVIRDFFGIFKFNLVDSENKSKEKVTIGILPENKEPEQEEDWLASARTAAFDGEEPESSTDDMSVTFNGFPGYEHRDYVPGDPIKRINYKLSARMDKLQVRLDEQQAVAGITLMLAPRLPEDSAEIRGGALIKSTSHCLDEMMSVAQHLHKLDFAVTACLPMQDKFDIKNEKDLEILREKLSVAGFSTEARDCVPGLKEMSGTVIAFIPYQEDYTVSKLKEYAGTEGNHVIVYISSIEKGRRL